METSRRKIVVFGVCVGGMLFLSIYGCKAEIEPIVAAPANDYVAHAHYEVVRDDGTTYDLPDVVEVNEGDGLIIQIGIEHSISMPTEHEGKAVVERTLMPLMVDIRPRGNHDPEAVLHGAVQAIDPPKLSRTINLLNDYESPFWSGGGKYKGQKRTDKVLANRQHRDAWRSLKELWYLSYLCADKGQSGEFVYEIHLLPTGRWISPVRWEYGSPVVLKRGLLRVIPLRQSN